MTGEDQNEAEGNGDPVYPTIRCRFTIVGQEGFDPDEVTRRTGLTPSSCWRKGDAHTTPTGRTLPPRTHSHWGLKTATVSTLDLPGLLDTLLDIVEPHRATISEIVAQTGAETEVSAHVFMSEQTPIGTIPLATLRRIVALGADFDLDLYVG